MSPSPDPNMVKAWQALSNQLGREAALAFFENHVLNGHNALEAMGELATASVMELAAKGAAASDAEAPRLGTPPTTRPATRVNLKKQQRILDRKWLVTGYILRLGIPGREARRIPLNYSSLLIGHEGSHADIEIPLGDTGTCQLRVAWSGGAFSMEYDSGTIPVSVNDLPLNEPCELKDGDVIHVGRAQMRIFRLLEPAAELVVVSGQGAGERFIIDTSEVRLGRFGKRDNDICLQDPTVSREHASIMHQDGKFMLVPESTTSPSIVNGEALSEPRPLVDNDQVVLGEQTLLFRVRGGSVRPKTLHSRVATILFSDLRGWTPLAEHMPLQDLIAQMDDYFKAMGEIVSVHGGTLLTYQGDAIMAVFGAPSSHKDDPWRAVASAVQMQERLGLMNVKWETMGRPPLACGIGIHTGLCMVGEMGHQSRLEYTAMGDTANLAARLEQLTKEFQCDIILSEVTYSEVQQSVDVEDLGEVTVKGRSVPTRLYSVKGLRDARQA